MLLLTNLSYLEDLKISFLEEEAKKFKKEVFLNINKLDEIYDIFLNCQKCHIKENKINFIQTNYLLDFEDEKNIKDFYYFLKFLKKINVYNISIKVPKFEDDNEKHKDYFLKLKKILKGFKVFLQLNINQDYLYLYNVIQKNKLKYKVIYKPEIVYDQHKSITSTYQYLKPYIGCIILDDKIERVPVLLGSGKLRIFELLKKIISYNEKVIFIYENNFKKYLEKNELLNIAKRSDKNLHMKNIKKKIDPENKLKELTLDDITLYEILRLDRII